MAPKLASREVRPSKPPAKKSGEGRERGARKVVARGKKNPRNNARGAESLPPVRIRAAGGTLLEVPCGNRLQRAAMRWSYIARNRRRFDSSDPKAHRLQSRCRTILEEISRPGAGAQGSSARGEGARFDDALRALADSEFVEVSIPFLEEGEAWEARIFPWEFVLSLATKRHRDRKPHSFTIFRHLDSIGVRTRRQPHAGGFKRAAILEFAPGSLRTDYSFTFERTLLRDRLGIPQTSIRRISEVGSTSLSAEIRESAPGIVHVSGFDAHQGRQLLGLEPEGELRDGLLVSGSAGEPIVLDSERLAAALTSGTPRPGLITFNIYNSAARSAPLAVAKGAGAAIGFYDEIDDPTAEAFYAFFFSALKIAGGSVHAAFKVALDEVRESWDSLAGAGVVCWSAQPLLAGAPDYRTEQKFSRSCSQLRADLGRVRTTAVRIDTKDPSRSLSVNVEPRRRISYGMLHNGENLFEEFSLIVHEMGHLNDIVVLVELDAGAERPSFRTRISRLSDAKDLRAEIVLPLTSDLLRSLGQETWTTLHYKVEVERRGRMLPIREETVKVLLAPADEWRLLDEDVRWLPSFVQPQDRAVLRVIDSAQKFLCVLLDDASAGFDGYQSVNETSEEEAPATQERDEEAGEEGDPYAAVDAQVQAIWAAICHDHRLYYINPPPSFEDSSQRLRLPSTVIDGRRGTCIDLALLFAACLEFVEIHPVIFLFTDHAIPGYWRSENAREEFIELTDMVTRNPEEAPREDETIHPSRQIDAWVFGPEYGAYEQISRMIQEGYLVPLETVNLTQQGSFRDAIVRGEEHLVSKEYFHSMVDVSRSRQSVTPLPVLEARR